MALVVCCACALVAVGLAVALGVGQPGAQTAGEDPAQQAQTQAVQAQADPAEEYAQVVALVNRADKTVVPISKVISKTLDDKVATRIERLLERQQSATALLEQASARLQTATPELDPSMEGALAPTLSDSIAAREEMLAYGCVVLRASAGAYRATDPIVSLWQSYLDGHAELQEASDAVSSGTTKAVKSALRHDRRALKRFQKAEKLVEKVQALAPKADLSTERKYANLQVKAAKTAIATDRALLEEDEKAAKEHNAEYAAQAAEAAKAAESLPATTDALVKSVYYSFGTEKVSVQDAQEKYEAAAKRAAKDDRELAASSGSGTSKES